MHFSINIIINRLHSLTINCPCMQHYLLGWSAILWCALISYKLCLNGSSSKGSVLSKRRKTLLLSRRQRIYFNVLMKHWTWLSRRSQSSCFTACFSTSSVTVNLYVTIDSVIPHCHGTMLFASSTFIWIIWITLTLLSFLQPQCWISYVQTGVRRINI